VALSFSIATANAMADAIDAQVNSGSGAGKLRIYSGAKPTSPDDAATGTLLAECTLSDPAFGDASARAITLDISPAVEDTAANATGTAGYFRLVNSDNTGCVDGTITTTGGGGDLTLNTTSLVQDVAFSITSFVITQP